MLKTICKTVVLFIFIGTCLPVMAVADSSYDDPTLPQRMTDLLKSMDKPLTFYGRVIDQNGNPVVNAVVETHITDSSGVSDVMLTTGAEGKFELLNKYGRKIFINKIICTGYENDRKVMGEMLFENGSYTPDKNKPYIFTVRKKEPATLVLEGDLEWKIRPTISYYEVDLVERVFSRAGRLKEDNSQALADLRINSVLSPDKSSCIVTFDGNSTNSEILMNDTLLYVAPETGYDKTLSLEIPIGSKITRYFYVKGRNGGIYSRLGTTLTGKADGVIINVNIFTNPLGERNLDFNEALYSQYLQKRMDDDRQESIDRELRKLELYKKVQ